MISQFELDVLLATTREYNAVYRAIRNAWPHVTVITCVTRGDFDALHDGIVLLMNWPLVLDAKAPR